MQVAYRLCTLPVLLQVPCVLLRVPWVLREGEPLRVKRLALRCQFLRQQLLDHRSSSLWLQLSDLVEDLASLANTQLSQYVLETMTTLTESLFL